MGAIFSEEEDTTPSNPPNVASSSQAAAAPAPAPAPVAAPSSSVFSFLDRNQTFKPNKPVANRGTKRATLHSTMKASMKATLGGMSDMRDAVRCPPNESLNEWLAVNTVHFFNAASMVYGTCCQYCDEQKCPAMTAGPKVEYLWMDGKAYKKPTKMPALQYIELMFTWIEEQISDPALFPVEDGAQFPSDFKKIVSNIFRRLVRLYGHIYYSHFETCQEIGAEAHLNTCFKHLIYFIQCHDLVDVKELEPVQRLIDKFQKDDDEKSKK